VTTIKLFWSYFRNAMGVILLLWPLALAAWVFDAALRLGDAGGLWLAILGAGAVLVFFRSYWRSWAILLPAGWRLIRSFGGRSGAHGQPQDSGRPGPHPNRLE